MSLDSTDVPVWPFERKANAPLNPPPRLAELRSECPITQVELWDGSHAWLATRYADLPFMQDATYYEELAMGVANDWIAGQSSPWLESAMSQGHQPWLMVAVLAVFYFLAGGLQITPVAIALWIRILGSRNFRRRAV